MYYATGLPGFMRSGGGFGRGGGMGPCAQFLMTGQWPTPAMQSAWQSMQGQMPIGAPVAAADRLAVLEAQAAMLQQQLDAVRRQIAEAGSQQ